MTGITKLTLSDGERPAVSIPDRFRQVVSCHADRIAVSTSGGQWTYAELDERSTGLACVILDHLGAGDGVVALLFEHAAPLVAAILGVLKAGRIYLALDSSDSATSSQAMLVDAQTRLLVTDPPNAALARSLVGDSLKVLVVADEGAYHSASSPFVDIAPDAGAWLMYTSGSTGAPKGVWQSHRAVVHHVDVYHDLIRLTRDDRLSLITSCGRRGVGDSAVRCLAQWSHSVPVPLPLQGGRAAHELGATAARYGLPIRADGVPPPGGGCRRFFPR